jgi:hypothetical protein
MTPMFGLMGVPINSNIQNKWDGCENVKWIGD